ncbi:sigma-70 family RNA polymerase sigma factor [Bacillus sp. Cr_A10]|uniref:sigma-70 family RNA polymerase sigma factor n=1 Tax=Bacillus sp. Cr_A10 TaxID=3033993 RepID=UPI0023DC2C03|nr:sigma-70 family RNA polymerase sigma factor [Bacillus sp. Cr_A10]MDF2066507.1 sigma-70 family RNA polymerase sigma factor [Bacillus sp. Cr_A10]
MRGKSLVKRAIKGDEEAFLELMHSYQEALYRTAISYVKNEEDALEAVQEVTYRAYRSIKTVKEPAYFKTWLIRIMMNYCLDVLKRSNREIVEESLINRTGVSEDFTYMEVEEALLTLSDYERELLHLKYFEGVKIKDIAVMWNTPEGTIKTRLHKALRALRNNFDEKGDVKRV